MKRLSETRNKCYISCCFISFSILSEFLSNKNAIECLDFDKVHSMNFVGDDEIRTVEDRVR